MKQVLYTDFYPVGAKSQPVRKWLRDMDKEDRRTIGRDIGVLEFNWPIPPPLCKKIERDLWEIRSNLAVGRISRVFFTIDGNRMILLHAFIKKSQETLQKDLKTARARKSNYYHLG